ncbi:putative glycosyltransferase FCK3 [Exophiala dermatitidis]
MAASPQFSIPKEYQNELRYVDALDKRSDEDILRSLETHRPVTSEKNIWAFWDKGFRSMPGWCQRNVINWVRLCGPSWTVRVLDAIPDSPNYALNYVSADLLPQSFVNGTMTGVYVGPHSSDFLRGACLYTHGGVYMDVGIILTRDLDRICWNQLADPNSPYEVSAPIMFGTIMANHFVASRKGDPFIKGWHDIFVHLWKGRQNHEGIIQDPLVSFALKNTFKEAEEAKFNWDFSVEPQTVFEYIAQVLSWMRLCMLESTGTGDDSNNNTFSGTEYWLNKVLIFNALQEDWGAEATIGFGEQILFDALATKFDAPRGFRRKITHGKNLTKTPALGALWDEETNKDKDHEPGTFAELLRYGSVHFEQTRERIEYLEAQRPAETFKKGLLEP